MQTRPEGSVQSGVHHGLIMPFQEFNHFKLRLVVEMTVSPKHAHWVDDVGEHNTVIVESKVTIIQVQLRDLSMHYCSQSSLENNKNFLSVHPRNTAPSHEINN
jgi:hypothetical protein